MMRVPSTLRSSVLLYSSEKTCATVPLDHSEEIKCSNKLPTTSSYLQGTSPITELSSPNTISATGAIGADISPTENRLVDAPTAAHPISSSEYTALAGQFGTFIVVSTFTAALIIAFLSLARDIVNQPDAPDPVSLFHFDIGMFFGMSAIGLHIGIILVGGRATALCFRLAARTSHDLDAEANRAEGLAGVDFYRYVRYCDHLQFMASITLLSFFLFLVYTMFIHKAFFWILLGLSAIGGFSIFNAGFWRVSISLETARDTWSWFIDSWRSLCRT